MMAGRTAPSGLAWADLTAKALFFVLTAAVLIDPGASNLEGKAPELRVVAYPLLAVTVPVIWWVWWRHRAPFPWLVDLLVTLVCFTDLLGNRANLYDTVVWFDDWMHFANTGLLAAALVLLTMDRETRRIRAVERAVAFAAPASIGWEIGEYFAFVHGSPERTVAYTDTLGDLALGTLGAATAAVLVHTLWRHGRLLWTDPLVTGARARPY
ncbi:hypothetical protein GCM10023169_22470 [Georgenia halophila]|uniref:Uncharacterized protein n=2 Tax=Georgenia halophila TaxID=620889 RepID=A0ABP8LA65_9MICO